MRPLDEIRADLAVERSGREWSDAVQRLLADVPHLLEAVERISAAWAEVIQREQRGDNAHWYDLEQMRARAEAAEARLADRSAVSS